ncbi:hypothetical protein PUNSTDRAFT_104025 [Punctularia strigosozonata HHB-11173 SS5]|uniref:uncharacterized protein n=1 Tax=Punctularia strigosozonata (strain HHB-11173) TaxID=741275 RepID=UPI00044169C8|nr:uncharacterized protein PUNSTDRAFT_104025 [Punctularia strigosozonata HHB-11173 SS5]EIN07896.1 hypothetical protein PUNSTDRAFT_104025 [Punctularia strigosozonata HHB-11173 SS5]
MTTTRSLPPFDELPHFHEFSGCAWDVWPADDQLGTLNLLTDDVVRRAAQEEIKTGVTVSLNWPINFPEKPFFKRKKPEIKNIALVNGDPSKAMRDDEIHINTQSGSQWDGLKHFGVLKYAVYYKNTPASDFPVGEVTVNDPSKVTAQFLRFGIQNWANHGICGRGVLLDMVNYYEATGRDFDPWVTQSVTLDDIEGCAKAQGVSFRPGDILLLRVGFIKKYYASTQEEKDSLSGRPTENFAGIEQSEDMKRFLWNNHFSAVASDQPSLERWPPPQGSAYLHETLLGLWGMPIGEFFDLEKLSTICAETGRYTFFFSSWPLNVLGGIASPPNAAAYF